MKGLSRAYEELKHRIFKTKILKNVRLSRAYEELKLISNFSLRTNVYAFIACLWGIETRQKENLG